MKCLCPYCGGPVHERLVGDDESLTFCNGDCDDMLLEGVDLLTPQEAAAQFRLPLDDVLEQLTDDQFDSFVEEEITAGIRVLEEEFERRRTAPRVAENPRIDGSAVGPFVPTHVAHNRRDR